MSSVVVMETVVDMETVVVMSSVNNFKTYPIGNIFIKNKISMLKKK